MKIYVDEMPVSCEKCPLCIYFDRDAHGKGKHEVACSCGGTVNNILFGHKLTPKTCNVLKLIKEHDKEIRKQVCDDIKVNISILLDKFIRSEEYHRNLILRGRRLINAYELLDIIDQIEKGDKYYANIK